MSDSPAMTRQTTVISVRGGEGRFDELMADPNFVYVGRRVPFTHWFDSRWGNPFKSGMNPLAAMRIFDLIPESDQRQSTHLVIDGPLEMLDVIEWYETYVKARRVLWDYLHELRGKTLGCWCGEWKPGDPDLTCHAVVLAKLANALPEAV